jgi:hypothetical protein
VERLRPRVPVAGTGTQKNAKKNAKEVRDFLDRAQNAPGARLAAS